jgi:hypothetical protein
MLSRPARTPGQGHGAAPGGRWVSRMSTQASRPEAAVRMAATRMAASKSFGNPSSGHSYADGPRRVLARARAQVAALISARPGQARTHPDAAYGVLFADAAALAAEPGLAGPAATPSAPSRLTWRPDPARPGRRWPPRRHRPQGSASSGRCVGAYHPEYATPAGGPGRLDAPQPRARCHGVARRAGNFRPTMRNPALSGPASRYLTCGKCP